MRDRRGAALIGALLALLVISVLAAVALGWGRLHWLGGTRQLNAASARLSAEAEVERLVGRWPAARAESMPVGAAVAVGAVVPTAPNIRLADSLFRLGPSLYLMRVAGEQVDADGHMLAQGGMTRLVELALPKIADGPAITAGSVVQLGSAVVDGSDHVPLGWESHCPPAGATMPPWQADTGFTRLLYPTLEELEIQAQVAAGGTLAPHQVDSAGQCDRSSASNWGGAPGGPCADYFPLIRAADPTRLDGGYGQGFLLATGRLELAGHFSFAGVILSLGPVFISDQSEVAGVLLSLESVEVSGQAKVRRSACAVERALSRLGRPYRRLFRGTWR